MIGGLSAIHAWTPPGAIEPVIELNRIKDDSGDPVWPRYRVRNILGLKSLPDPEDNRDRPPGRRGERARLSGRRGKTVVYEGWIEARSLFELEEADSALRAAFAEIATEGRMDVFWHSLHTTYAAVPPKFYEARALTCDIVEVQNATTWTRPFVIGLRNGDGRYFDEESEIYEVNIALSETTYEFVKGGLTMPENVRGPRLTLALPKLLNKHNVLLENTTTEQQLRLSLGSEWDGDDLLLDFPRRTILDQEGKDKSSRLDSEVNSLWTPEPLIPGKNDLRITVNREPESEAKALGAVATLAWEKGYY